MAGIGDDIKDVLQELGKEVDVYRHTTKEIVVTEHVDTEGNVRETTPFESTHMNVFMAAYDTSIQLGDRLDFTTTSESYLVGTWVPQSFENEIYANEGVLYRCNSEVDVYRRSGETRDPQTYDLVPNWEPVFSGELGLFSGRLSDHDIADERYGRFYQSSRMLFISKDLDLQREDRCVIDGERYNVETMETHRLPGLKICGLAEDNRE